jgi:transcriptional regulator with XRE-family HTH domain
MIMARPKVKAFSEQLRDAMGSSGRTGAELAKLAGVDPGVISRFLAGKREIRTGTVDRITTALSLRLVEVERQPKGKGPRPAKTKG